MERSIKVAAQVNALLQEYYQRTSEIKNLIQFSEEDDFVERLNKLIDARDSLIEKYNKLRAEHGEIEAPDNGNAEWERLLEERRALAASISEIDGVTIKKIENLKGQQKEKIKQINMGRKMFNAYNYNMPIIDGIFFDKRK